MKIEKEILNCFAKSWQPISSVSHNFESGTKYYLSFELTVGEGPFDYILTKPSTMLLTAFTTMESSRNCKYICFPLSHPSSLYLLDIPENIPHCFNDPNSDTLIVNFGMWVFHLFLLPITKGHLLICDG